MESDLPLSNSGVRKSRGRPAGEDATDIRGGILDAAEALFAQKGYAATSVREIADEVDVNPAMIHYYFGSKISLLQSVLERTMEPLAEALSKMRTAGQSPVSEIVHLLVDTLSKRPNLPPLVAREVMLPGGVMQEHFLEYLAPRLGGAIPQMLEQEQADGRMDPTLDPRISTLMLLATCIFPFIAKGAVGPGLKVSYDEDGIDSLESHVKLLLDRGFSP